MSIYMVFHSVRIDRANGRFAVGRSVCLCRRRQVVSAHSWARFTVNNSGIEIAVAWKALVHIPLFSRSGTIVGNPLGRRPIAGSKPSIGITDTTGPKILLRHTLF